MKVEAGLVDKEDQGPVRRFFEMGEVGQEGEEPDEAPECSSKGTLTLWRWLTTRI